MVLVSVLAAIACGFLSGLGIGGGSLLMVYLTAVAALPQHTAQGINLLYFIPAACCALIFHSKNHFVRWKQTKWAIAGGVGMAIAGALIASRVSPELLRKLFGVFLLFTGLSELRTNAK